MPLPFQMVSADSHVVEPPDLWTTRIDKPFRDRAPKIVTGNKGDCFIIDGMADDRLVTDGNDDRGLLGLVATKAKYADVNTQFGIHGRWADVPEGAYDPNARVKELDREGIEAELIYTTLGLPLFGLGERDYRHACMAAFNDWLAEHCSAAPKRLFGVAMIATDDVDRAVAELERCVKNGLRGAMISIDEKSGEGYGAAKYDKFWSAAEALEIPISLHVAGSETFFNTTGSMFVDFTCGFTPTMYTIISMIFSGLFDRHPKLKVLSVENDASWALSVLERMDDRWKHDRLWAPELGKGATITSGRLPSQIFHEHVACTFLRDRTAILNREIIGRENLMWGADFPHFDGAWPLCASVLERQYEGVPLADQMAIGRNNVIRWYNLPLELAQPARTRVAV